MACTLNGGRRLVAAGVLLPHQRHLKTRESSLAALSPKLKFQGVEVGTPTPPPRRRAPRGDLWQQTMAEKKTLVSVVSALQAAAGPETPPHLRRLVSQCQALMAAQPIVG